ncbi:hypothetical protein KAJ61_06165 [Candidatus Parcubacteria bacterium]|nr:hypothetical protein [Candidatus Parcubacteria bacterium]
MKERKKLLAIHSNKIFFKKNAPNFYEWICGKRGLDKPYQCLKKEYCNGEKGPRALSETFELAISGLTPIEFEIYIEEYIDKYQLEKIAEKLKKLSKKFKIMIFSSLPIMLFDNLFLVTDNIFCSEYVVKRNKINRLRLIHLTLGEKTEEEKNKAKYLPPFSKSLRKPKNHKVICQRLDDIGLSEIYNSGTIEMGNVPDYVDYIQYCRWLYIEPDRYGMLICLINEMIEGGYDKKDVIALGKGETAKPMHKMAGRIIENLEELN